MRANYSVAPYLDRLRIHRHGFVLLSGAACTCRRACQGRKFDQANSYKVQAKLPRVAIIRSIVFRSALRGKRTEHNAAAATENWMPHTSLLCWHAGHQQLRDSREPAYPARYQFRVSLSWLCTPGLHSSIRTSRRGTVLHAMFQYYPLWPCRKTCSDHVDCNTAF